MDLIDKLREISARVPRQKDLIKTEEATKNAFVMPFINALGYNVFDPSEVVPEFTADHGTKKGEKVDYAIMHEGKPSILFECKRVGTDLVKAPHSQLFRYFSVTTARIGVLTNGIEYRFFTDLEEKNKLDSRPFIELSLEDVQESVVADLKSLTKSTFDLDKVIDSAEGLKYSKAIQALLADQLDSPSPEFVKFFASEVHPGRRLTQNVMETFTDLVKEALNEFIAKQVDGRLKSALSQGKPEQPEAEAEAEAGDQELKSPDSKIVTTEEEIEGHRIIKAILRETIDVSRVHMRDGQSYCAILLDNNNRKPICRLFFNNTKRLALGIINADRSQEKIPLSSLDEMYSHADKLKATVARHEASGTGRHKKV